MKDPHSTCLAIQKAGSEEQVIAVVREYLVSLAPEQAALIPATLSALTVTQAEELVQSALHLVHREMLSSLDAPDAAFLKEASLVFSTAATRLAALSQVRPRPHAQSG